mmetsp:Transcript_24712/g.44387  ORF Transcript_24712/g.44387 Transcript_24712/m.44387 type:complete len:204 (+) Transcript_24712:751-1362(+)
MGGVVRVALDPNVMGFGADFFVAASFLSPGAAVVSLVLTVASSDPPCSGTEGRGSFKDVVGAACNCDLSAMVDSLGLLLEVVEASLSFGDLSKTLGTGASDDDESASCFFLAASFFSASSFLAIAAALRFFNSVIFSFISSSFLDVVVADGISFFATVDCITDFFCVPLAREMRALALSAAASDSVPDRVSFFAAADCVAAFF